MFQGGNSDLATLTWVCRLASLASSGSLLVKQNPRLHLPSFLQFKKVPRLFVCTLKLRSTENEESGPSTTWDNVAGQSIRQL